MLQRIQHTRLLPFAMLWLWGLVFWNNFSNKHVHLTENGHRIVHAHPMQQGDADHEHTEKEYIFWDLISNAHFHSETPSVCIPAILAISLTDFKRLSVELTFSSLDKTPNSLRGPPIFFS